MPVQIAIYDHSPDDVKKLSEALYAYDDSFQIAIYSNGEFLAADCLENEGLFDILFLDVYMPSFNGFNMATKIRSAGEHIYSYPSKLYCKYSPCHRDDREPPLHRSVGN